MEEEAGVSKVNKFDKLDNILTDKRRSSWSIKWICLDKNEKFVYGIKVSRDAFELIVLHLFSRMEKFIKKYPQIKRIQFRQIIYSLPVGSITPTVKVCADEDCRRIGLMSLQRFTCTAKPAESLDVVLFQVINLDSGVMNNYVLCLHYNDVHTRPYADFEYALNHSNSIGWIIVIRKDIYKFVIGSNGKDAQLVLLTTAKGNIVCPTTMAVLNEQLFLFPPSRLTLSAVDVFNSQTNEWIHKQIRLPSTSYNRQNLVTVREQKLLGFAKKSGYMVQLLMELGDFVWMDTDIKCTFSDDRDSDIMLECALVGKRMIFFNFIDKRVFPDGNRKSRSNHTFITITNVLTLQDLCLLRLVNTYSNLFEGSSEHDFQELFDFPHTLVRKYFGPVWPSSSNDKLDSCFLCNVDSIPFFNSLHSHAIF